MGKYFSTGELSRSETALRAGIDNTPPAAAVENIQFLINELLDPIRAAWGRPLRVNSGYRAQALNKAVGGSPTSQHLSGQAADITAGSRELNQRLFRLIMSGGFVFDQLIDEKGYSWIHISYCKDNNRKQVFHL